MRTRNPDIPRLPPWMDRSLTLSDGRKLSYGDFGDSRAAPLFYCHGYPTNRIEYEIIDRAVRNSGINVRVVVLDRPGYGSSTFQPGRTLLDWPRDIADAADKLGVHEFALLGVSGGGPFALACAAAMPDRVARLGLVVAAGPANAPGMHDSLILRTLPKSGVVRRFQFGMMSAGLKRGSEDVILDRTIANLGEVDRPFLGYADKRAWFIRMMHEAFAQGGRPAAQDGGIYLDSWGFDVSEVNTETHLWYGARDETVPASVGEWFAEKISDSKLVVWPEHGHFTWMTSAEAVDVVAVTGGVTRNSAYPASRDLEQQRATDILHRSPNLDGNLQGA